MAGAGPGGPGPDGKLDMKKLPRLERDRIALELRTNGASWRQIAKSCEYSSEKVAQSAVQRAAETEIAASEDLDTKVDLVRLEKALKTEWETVRAGADEKAKKQALDRVLRLIDARKHLLATFNLAMKGPSALALALEGSQGEQLLGPPETVIRKKRVLEALEDAFTVTGACKLASVPLATYWGWYANDPIFRNLAQGAAGAVIDRVEGKLLDLADRGNVTAVLAFLNAHHPSYGRIRYEVLERICMPFIEDVGSLLEEFVPASSMDAVRTRLFGSFERLTMATVGAKSRGR